jgi:hypothetical protein
MSLASALNILRPTLPYYVALHHYSQLRLTSDSFEFDPNPAAPALAVDMAKTRLLPTLRALPARNSSRREGVS